MPSENIVIKVNADDLDAKLSKAMKELGAHHDQYGRLINKQNQYIGSLSAANVRMGMYIDSQGKMRDAAGRLVEGLTAAERALRMYINAEGDVVTADGKFVRASQEKIALLEQEKRAREAATGAISSAMTSLGQLNASLSTTFAVLASGTAEGSKLARVMSEMTSGTSAILGYAGAVLGVAKAVRGLAAASALLTKSNAILAALTLVVAGALWAWEKFTKKTEQTSSSGNSPMRRQIVQINALRTALIGLHTDLNRVNRTQLAFATALASPVDVLKMQSRQLDVLRRKGTRAEFEQKKGEYAQNFAAMIQQDRPEDPTRDLRQRIGLYEKSIQGGSLSGQLLQEAQETLANAYKKYAAEFKIDSQSALDEAVRKAAEDFGESSQAFKEVSQNLREAYSRQKLQQSQSFVDSLRDQIKTPMERLKEEQDKLTEAYRQGLVSSDEMARMNAFLRDRYQEKAEEIEKPENAQVEERYHAPKSMEYGSQQLYEVLTQRNQDTWRTKMQGDLAEVRKQGEDANEYLRDMRDGIRNFNEIGTTA